MVTRVILLRNEPEKSADIKNYFPLSARICLAAIVLCRLDDCFWVLAIGLFVVMQRGIGLDKKARLLLYIFWPTAFAIIAYMTYNLLALGVMLPVSATAKMHLVTGSFGRRFLSVLGGSGTKIYDWWYYAVRVYPIIFSLLVGVLCTYLSQRPRHLALPISSIFESSMLICGLFLIAKALFLIIFVTMLDQGYWYYYSMLDMCNIMFAMVVGWIVKSYINKARFLLLFFGKHNSFSRTK